jgi:hypothetical protein
MSLLNDGNIAGIPMITDKYHRFPFYTTFDVNKLYPPKEDDTKHDPSYRGLKSSELAFSVAKSIELDF